MHQATLLHQVLNFLVVFWVNNTRYDFGECTIETAVLENIGVALGIFDVSFLDSEIGGGVKFYPGVVQYVSLKQVVPRRLITLSTLQLF
jgi:hypothetical protein